MTDQADQAMNLIVARTMVLEHLMITMLIDRSEEFENPAPFREHLMLDLRQRLAAQPPHPQQRLPTVETETLEGIGIGELLQPVHVELAG